MEIEASLTEGSGGAKRAAVLNLGPDGAFVRCDAKLEQGAKVLLAFDLPSHPIAFKIDAEVRWVKAGEKGGAGLQFMKLGAYDRSVLDDYCQRLVEVSRGGDAGRAAD